MKESKKKPYKKKWWDLQTVIVVIILSIATIAYSYIQAENRKIESQNTTETTMETGNSVKEK